MPREPRWSKRSRTSTPRSAAAASAAKNGVGHLVPRGDVELHVHEVAGGLDLGAHRLDGAVVVRRGARPSCPDASAAHRAAGSAGSGRRRATRRRPGARPPGRLGLERRRSRARSPRSARRDACARRWCCRTAGRRRCRGRARRGSGSARPSPSTACGCRAAPRAPARRWRCSHHDERQERLRAAPCIHAVVLPGAGDARGLHARRPSGAASPETGDPGRARTRP